MSRDQDEGIAKEVPGGGATFAKITRIVTDRSPKLNILPMSSIAKHRTLTSQIPQTFPRNSSVRLATLQSLDRYFRMPTLRRHLVGSSGDAISHDMCPTFFGMLNLAEAIKLSSRIHSNTKIS